MAEDSKFSANQIIIGLVEIIISAVLCLVMEIIGLAFQTVYWLIIALMVTYPIVTFFTSPKFPSMSKHEKSEKIAYRIGLSIVIFIVALIFFPYVMSLCNRIPTPTPEPTKVVETFTPIKTTEAPVTPPLHSLPVTSTPDFTENCFRDLWLLSPDYLNQLIAKDSTDNCLNYGRYGFTMIDSGSGFNIKKDQIDGNSGLIGIYKLVLDPGASAKIVIDNWQNGISEVGGHIYFGFCDHTKTTACINDVLKINYGGDPIRPEIYLNDDPIVQYRGNDGDIEIVCRRLTGKVSCEFPHIEEPIEIPLQVGADSVFIGYELLDGGTINIDIPLVVIDD